MNDWQEPAVEAAREEIFSVLDRLRDAGRKSSDGTARERLGWVSLFLIQSLRLLEGHFMAAEVPLEAWRMPIPDVPMPQRAIELLERCDRGPGKAGEICRRLLLGPEIYRTLAGTDDAPTTQEIVDWLRWLRDEDGRLLAWGMAAARLDATGSEILIELHLDELLMAEDWSHPSQVLVRPRPPWSLLLDACSARLEANDDASAAMRLRPVQEKLERAIRIEEKARRRRHNRKSRAKE